MAGTCNVRMVSTPFGINGVECYEGDVNITRPHVLNHIPVQSPPITRGIRAVRQLSVKDKNINYEIEKPVFMASLHHKGKLLIWDSDTLDVLGVCDHHGSSVAQCVVTPTYLFVRVENDNGYDDDADSKVYIWNTKTFDLFRQIHAHDGRVTSIVVSNQNDANFATAGVDHYVNIWNLTKDNAIPVRKISTNGSTMVSIYFNGMILGGFTNTPVIVWDAETGEEIQKPKDSSESVTALCWLHIPKRVVKNPSKSQDNFGALLIGYNDGFVKEWSTDISKKKLLTSLKWAYKVHRAHVTDLCGDGDVILSCSALDGAYLTSSSRGHIAPLVSYGVRIGLLDAASKSAIVGVDDGSVKVFSYSDFASSMGEPIVISSFHPHTSGITGLFLQLRENEAWDRLICSGADGTIAFLDYSKTRGGRWIKGMGAQSVDFIPKSEAILMPMEFTGGISVMDSADILPFPKQPKLELSKVVTSVRWVEGFNKLLVGCEDGTIIFFEGVVGEDRTPNFHKIEERKFYPYFSRNITISEPDESLAVVNLKKGVLSHEGAFVIVNNKEADLTYPIQPLTKIFPIRSNLVTFTGSNTYDYTVIIQLRDGNIIQFCGNSIRKTSPIFIRNIIGSTLTDALKMESTGLSVFPCSYTLKILQNASGKPDLVITYGEGSKLKQAIFNVTPSGNVERHEFAKKDVAIYGGSSMGDVEEIVAVTPIQHGELSMAILRDSPYVDIITSTGEYVYRISYNGDVMNYQIMGRRRRSRSFPFDTAVLSNSMSFAPSFSPAACAAEFCSTTHYLAIGYRDGLVQLFDTTQRVIFTRFAVHTSMISGLWAFPHAVLSCTSDNLCYGGVVLRRVMFGDNESKSVSANTSTVLLRRISGSTSTNGY